MENTPFFDTHHTPETNLLVFGTEEPPVEPIRFEVGPFEGMVEPDSGQLRYLRWNGMEVVRGIYATVRKDNWGTVVPKLSDFESQLTKEAFTCQFRAKHDQDGYRFEWTGTIRVTAEGEVEYVFDGSPLVDFKTARTGICLLHPLNVAGLKVEVEHADGPCENTQFPVLIQPDNPFSFIKSMTYEPVSGVEVRFEFEGILFEIEDQRNWSDNSFKTYCHPQSLGWPYPLEKGQEVRQAVRLKISNPSGEFEGDLDLPQMTKMPSLGTLVRGELGRGQLERLENLVGHVQATPEGLTYAHRIDVPVFLRTQTPTLPSVLSPRDGIILTPPEKSAGLASIGSGHRFAGSDGNFTELNRNRPKVEDCDGVAFAMNAQVHAFDSRTIVETGWTHGDCARTAKSFHPGQVIAGPIDLAQGRADARTSSLVALGFALASIRTLGEGGADYATFFDAETLLASPASLLFTLLRNAEPLPDLRGEDPYWVMVTVKVGRSKRVLIANLMPEKMTVETGVHFGKLKVLDRRNVVQWRDFMSFTTAAATETLELDSHAFAVIDTDLE